MPFRLARQAAARYGATSSRGMKKGRGGVSIEVDAKELIKKLEGLEQYTAQRVLNAATKHASRIIDAKTRDLYTAHQWKSEPRKQGFRKRIRQKGAFKYTTKPRKGVLYSTSGFNYKHPEMRLGFLLEMGHKIGGSSRKTKPMMYRHRAYKLRVKKAQRAFIRAFKFALSEAGKHPKGYVSEKAITAKLGDPWK